MSDYVQDCEICGTHSWTRVYVGDVRDGVYGRICADTQVFRCGGCGVERLDEAACPDEAFYETPAYRQRLQEELSKEGHYAVEPHSLHHDSPRDRDYEVLPCALAGVALKGQVDLVMAESSSYHAAGERSLVSLSCAIRKN